MNSTLTVVVREKIPVAARVTRFVLAHPRGDLLPAFSPGSHITITTPSGMVRSYSLTDPDVGGDYYAVAVQREREGRGGSVSLIDGTNVGDELTITAPSNAFPLVDADDYLFIAGGIGVTAIRSLYEAVRLRPNTKFRFLYLVRHVEDAAFADSYAMAAGPVVHASSVSGRADLWNYLEEPGDTHLYCCGSAALMDQVRALSMHWNPRRVHFEDFAGAGATSAEVPFKMIWDPTGQQLEVGPNETALDALRRSKVPALSSCVAGTCGTCVLRVISGKPEHRDVFLDEESQRDRFLPCVSRAASDYLRVGPID